MQNEENILDSISIIFSIWSVKVEFRSSFFKLLHWWKLSSYIKICNNVLLWIKALDKIEEIWRWKWKFENIHNLIISNKSNKYCTIQNIIKKVWNRINLKHLNLKKNIPQCVTSISTILICCTAKWIIVIIKFSKWNIIISSRTFKFQATNFKETVILSI